MRRKPFEEIKIDSEKLRKYFDNSTQQEFEQSESSSDSKNNIPKEDIFDIGDTVNTDELIKKKRIKYSGIHQEKAVQPFPVQKRVNI